MPNAVNHVPQQEFWTPPQEARPTTALGRSECCAACGTEYVIGSRFCHACGEEREPLMGDTDSPLTRWLDFGRIRDSLGLTAGALVAFIVGLGFLVAAFATGLVYSATTLLDWQAVQIWRIEWLLAAIAAFMVGILLKSCK